MCILNAVGYSRVEIIFCPIYNCIVDYNAQFLDITKLKFSKISLSCKHFKLFVVLIPSLHTEYIRANHIMMKFRRKEKRNFNNES